MRLTSRECRSYIAGMTHAIVLAAGKGTRMRSPLAKVLHPLLGEPLIAYPLRALVHAGVRDFTVVVGHAASEVEAAVRALPFLAESALRFVLQSEQRGTGHAVQLALAAAPEADAFFIASGDTPHVEGEILQRLASERGSAPLSVLVAEVAEASGLGRVVTQGARIQRIVEERDADAATRAVRLVNAGAYHVQGAFLREHIVALAPHNAQHELYLTDLVSEAAGEAVAVVAPETVALGVNSQAELARSGRLLRQAIVRRWHDAGVTIEEDALIGPAVTCEAGARIERGATLLGATHVGAGAVIEHHAHLDHVRVGAGAIVRAFSYAEHATLGAATRLGPMARLRGQAELLAGAEVGNFCEVKASVIGKQSKSHHVSYLGDATIGDGVNIGAGTIICNYDGFNKPHSRIGDGTFVGSNSTLVAPVDIGRGAYVAAGSVITRPVADEALAIGRARQENKEGYATKLRAQLKAKKP
jgi:bifunctional UDP-N-acetylglucosamine pyrophosphorylase/glucosamine-1-phosphate N-acetyltransferase